ncbi:imidazole glycerol phosphate synthase subunit HisF [Cyanobium sp. ATX 6E8]|uniref:imidazole glycerol phosphate synthase subunit HisH n=1 Tax=Cyanobium sp. ATX 6E8 TaxID=2823701 RepID=UPI0020CBCF8C|nr:imidazole glycerol phosphate synthase subunit HisH [Cyanobium sp. ATX 6E8]MCP9941912.1 imidazole glycerol phosphate synthase subunit HisF [Cyanobium sp. ATX 6E8]
MALCKRLIARLDIKGSRLIKGIRFEGLRVLGDPWESALRYAQAGADELLYIDAVASLYGRNGLAELLRSTSREVFIPITAGGGVRSVADAAALLAAGADKIAVNTAALQRPELITELAEAFGSQCVVASIQARRTGPGAWEAMAEAGRERSGRNVLVWLEHAQQLGAGELLLTSVDQDGTCAGPDQPLLEAAASRVRVPLVLGGGFAAADHVLAAFEQPKLSAVSLGAALHHQRLELAALKRELAVDAPSLPLRLPAIASESPQATEAQPLAGVRMSVIDYGMGNQQSLINALEMLGAEAMLSDQPDQLRACNVLALPGVGAFPQGMAALRSRGLDAWLVEWVASGKPLLGICLGMQMMFEAGEEFGACAGLGLLRGRVTALPDHDAAGEPLILPHMGWNRLLPGPAAGPQPSSAEPLNQYFVHSYAATGVDPEAVLFHCRYGHQPFVAAVRQGPVAGFQFHPERSGPAGLALLADTCQELLR